MRAKLGRINKRCHNPTTHVEFKGFKQYNFGVFFKVDEFIYANRPRCLKCFSITLTLNDVLLKHNSEHSSFQMRT